MAGAVLLLAAGAKAYWPVHGSTRQVFPVPLQIVCEVALATWILSGFAAPLCRRVSTVAFSLFLLVAASGVVRGDSSCGCFGGWNVKPLWMLSLDAVLLALMIIGKPERMHTRRLKPWPWTAFALATICALGWTRHVRTPTLLGLDSALGTIGSELVVLDPQGWVGQACPLLRYIDVGDVLAEGDWTVFVYQHGCNQCRKLLRRPDLITRPSTRLALIELPPFANEADELKVLARDSIIGRIDSKYEWIAKTPLIIQLSNGKVLQVDVAQTGVEGAKTLSWTHQAQ